MKNKIYLRFLFLSIVYMCSINIVSALGNDVICSYVNDKNENEKISATILGDNSDMNTIENLKIDGFPEVYYGNNLSSVATDYYVEFFGERKVFTAQDYYDTIGACPPYFYVYSTSQGNSYHGYFSSKKGLEQSIVSFTRNEDSSVKEDEEGNLVPTDEKFACELKAPDMDNNNNFQTLKITINYTKKTISPTIKFYDNLLEDYQKTFDYNQKDTCPTDLYLCRLSGVQINETPYYVMSESQKKSRPEFQCVPFTSTDKDIEIGTDACKGYTDLRKEYVYEYNLGNYGASREKLNELKAFCRIHTENDDIDDNKYSCINLCLNIKNDILPLDINSGECGFSNKLINFVLNILKWVKYLVPALIIILSILDFIKAIGADKDEEMKKAQQKFIKRLVIAVLIFIVPFIIEFALDKMGFSYKDCGIF